MAKVYDPIMCMMVDEPTKAQDAKSLGKYKLPNGEIVEVIDRKNVHGVDTIVYKNSRGVHFATVDWFMSNAKKVYDSASALGKAISTCDTASGDAMKQIASTAKAWAKQYNQLFEKAATAEEVKKLKSQKDNDYRRAMDNLDKIYNEVSQVYGRARSEVRDLFDEVDSNGFKAYQRVTGGKK